MLIYASSCHDYFAEHGEAFIASAKKQGHKVRVDRMQKFPEWRERLDFQKEKVFACYLRWLRLPDLLEKDDVLVCDIDSIIMQPISFSHCDMALFFRPWIPSEERKILLTASYWAKGSKPFAEEFRKRILAGPRRWMDDQIICWHLFNEIGHNFRVQKLDQDFVCYNFDREAPIWTCKGPERKSNPVYLERRAQC